MGVTEEGVRIKVAFDGAEEIARGRQAVVELNAELMKTGGLLNVKDAHEAALGRQSTVGPTAPTQGGIAPAPQSADPLGRQSTVGPAGLSSSASSIEKLRTTWPEMQRLLLTWPETQRILVGIGLNVERIARKTTGEAVGAGGTASSGSGPRDSGPTPASGGRPPQQNAAVTPNSNDGEDQPAEQSNPLSMVALGAALFGGRNGLKALALRAAGGGTLGAVAFREAYTSAGVTENLGDESIKTLASLYGPNRVKDGAKQLRKDLNENEQAFTNQEMAAVRAQLNFRLPSAGAEGEGNINELMKTASVAARSFAIDIQSAGRIVATVASSLGGDAKQTKDVISRIYDATDRAGMGALADEMLEKIVASVEAIREGRGGRQLTADDYGSITQGIEATAARSKMTKEKAIESAGAIGEGLNVSGLPSSPRDLYVLRMVGGWKGGDLKSMVDAAERVQGMTPTQRANALYQSMKAAGESEEQAIAEAQAVTGETSIARIKEWRRVGPVEEKKPSEPSGKMEAAADALKQDAVYRVLETTVRKAGRQEEQGETTTGWFDRFNRSLEDVWQGVMGRRPFPEEAAAAAAERNDAAAKQKDAEGKRDEQAVKVTVELVAQDFLRDLVGATATVESDTGRRQKGSASGSGLD